MMINPRNLHSHSHLNSLHYIHPPNGRLKVIEEMIRGGRSFVSSKPAFSNDASRLLVCTGNSVSIFSTSTGLQTSELEGHTSQVTSVVVVPGDNVSCFCYTSSLDGTIKYWDFAAPRLIRTVVEYNFPIHSMVIPRFLRPTKENSGTNLYAYVHAEVDATQHNKGDSFCGQIMKCNLTKSRMVGGSNMLQTTKPRSINVGLTGKHIGVYWKCTVHVWEAEDSDRTEKKSIVLHHTKHISTVAFHPTERVVAAGDVTGRILVWRGVGLERIAKLTKGAKMKMDEGKPGVLGDDDAESCTTWHWHSSKVNLLFFSPDGSYLYSGGREGVLVVWQLDTGKKKFLPRIGSPLLYFITSPDPSLSSVSRSDNRIDLLRMPSMEVVKSISGIKLPSPSLEIYEGFGSGVVFNRAAGLVAVPTENYRVQFYSLFDDREVSEVQICQRNHHPGDEITVKVNLISLSQDGSTLCTAETRLPEEGIGSLVTLKFWSCGIQKKDLSLSTVIYEPHREADVSSIAFHPTRQMAASSSYGGDFKVWVNRQDISSKDQVHQNTGWTCHAVGSYKKTPMTAASFSSDGSVLAVSAERIITLWDPDTNVLVAVIGDCFEPIASLSFVGNSEYVVSASRGSNPQLTIWSMSRLSASWSYRLHAEDITCSLDGSTIAVLALSELRESDEPTRKGTDGVILLFNVASPVPLLTWSVSKAHGGRLSYVSLNSKSDHEDSEALVYMNSCHEYVLLNPLGDEQGKKLTISRQQNYDNTKEDERVGIRGIYPELPESSMEVDQTPISLMQTDKTWKTIFAGPSHSLRPLDILCSEFLESLLERRPTVVQ